VKPDQLPTDLVVVLEEGLTRSVRYFRRILKDEANARDLTQAQYNVLRQVAQDGPQRMSELAAMLELSNGATTGLVERLEARTLVTRGAAPGDGRGVVVSLTPEGARVVEEVLRAVKTAIARALAALSVPERHMALGGIQALADALERL
jgi:DNA-binding MarR family transcriptional regulator